MAKTFHLAIPVGDLDKAIEFYCNVLECKKGNSEANPPNSWCDIDFWGNELTLHASTSTQNSESHKVDMGVVLVPHFGVHLSKREFQSLKGKLLHKRKNVEFVDKPYVRFKGDVLEQETMFIKDPSGNVLEIKTMVNPGALFPKEGDLQNILGVGGIAVAHQRLKQNLKKLESVEKSYHHWGRTASGNSDDYDILRAELNKAEQNVIKSSRHFLQCLDDAKIEF